MLPSAKAAFSRTEVWLLFQRGDQRGGGVSSLGTKLAQSKRSLNLPDRIVTLQHPRQLGHAFALVRPTPAASRIEEEQGDQR